MKKYLMTIYLKNNDVDVKHFDKKLVAFDYINKLNHFNYFDDIQSLSIINIYSKKEILKKEF